MGGFIVLCVIVIAFICVVKAAKKQDTSGADERRIPIAPRRCPNCGSTVTQRGSRWECTWCGDFGTCGFLTLTDSSDTDWIDEAEEAEAILGEEEED